MNEADHKRITGMLREHFQAYIVVGFGMDGEKYRYCQYKTSLQAAAIEQAVRSELNQHAPAPEVWVRNMNPEED